VTDRSRKIILVLVTVVVTLGIAEIALRLTGYGVITPGMNFGVNTRSALDQGRFLPDPDLFWKLPRRPDDAALRAVHPDVPVPPRGNRRRILVMGDSCSRISTSRPPYSVLLERLLGGGPVEVWNAAVPGYTSWQGRAWLDRQLLGLRPEVAVVYYGWNDHWRATGITDRDYAARLSGGGLRLALLFRRIPDPPPLRVPAGEYRAYLTDIVTRLQGAGARVILVAAPHHLTAEARERLVRTRYVVEADDPVALHRAYLGVVGEVAAATGALELDAAAVFDRLDRPHDLMMRDGIHLTDPGHAVMAELIAAVLTAGPGGPPDTSALTARAAGVLAALDEAP